jgi:uncharacterized protein
MTGPTARQPLGLRCTAHMVPSCAGAGMTVSKRNRGAMADTPAPTSRRKTSARTPRGAARPRAAAVTRGAAKAAPAKKAPVRLGVIADTHGYLDPQVIDLFAGVTHIIHAGDTGDPAILARLSAVAPVSAVAGNIEPHELAELPRELAGQVPGVRFVVGHKRKRLLKRLAAGKIDLAAAGGAPNLVVCGHEHTPTVLWLDGVLHLNPGTASSPEEEDDGPTVAIVEVESAGLGVHFIPLPRRAESVEEPPSEKAGKAPKSAAGKTKPSAEKPAVANKPAGGKGKPAK